MPRKENEADRAAAHYRSLEARLTCRTRPAHLSLIILSALLLVSLGLGLCFLPHEEFSPEENRMLATLPEPSLDALIDGSLTRGLSDFCADQFPLRATFVAAKAGAELALFKQENNGVLYGQDGYLIKRANISEATYTALAQNVTAIRRFSNALTECGIPFDVAVVPRSVDVNAAKLPPLYPKSDATAVWERLQEECTAQGVTYQSLTEPLRASAEAGESVWFKTDHHWTPRGAYEAYLALADTLGYVPYPLSDFTEETVSQAFFGTTYASAGMRWTPAETLSLLRYEGDGDFVTEIIEGGKAVRSIEGLYDRDALATHDKYSVFLGGTNTHIRIRSTTATERPTLFLIKDSYAQSLSPFLARHFDLILLDPRTFKTASGTVSALITEYAPDRVLLLYGIDTLCDSSSLRILMLGLGQ
ncbi:MAG: hypothetical protein J6R04_05995 [Clostridia bacterium]|nr:hypothetical protein [Clostridia bacterium]